MKPVQPIFPDRPDTHQFEVIIAKDQPGVQPLPALLVRDVEGEAPRHVENLRESSYIITRFELDDDDIAEIIRTRSLFFCQWNHHGPLSPILIQVETPGAEPPQEIIGEPS
jgi:hypothetical protein